MPLYMHDLFGYPTAMALATVLGLAFGFVLERAGFGRATMLAAQFYGHDNRVLKVMFTAIAVNAAGLGLLGGLGVVDLSMLKVPETFVWPHLLGGLLLGVGFVVSGYCPGTAVVATSSGRMDAAYSLLGMMAGGLLFAAVWPWMEGPMDAGAMGVLQFTDLLGLPWPLLAAGVVVIAVGAFLAAEAAERWLAGKNKTQVPEGSVGVRTAVFVGLALLSGAGLLTVAFDAPQVAEVRERSVVSMDAVAVAEELVREPTSLYVVDMRSPEACAAKRLPGALCLPAGDAKGAFMADLPATRPLVLYGAGDMEQVPASALGYAGKVAVVSGGWMAIEKALYTAPVPPTAADAAGVASYRRRAALHGVLTGTRSVAPVMVRPAAVKRAVKKGGGC